MIRSPEIGAVTHSIHLMEMAAASALGTTLFSPTHRDVIERILRPMIGAGGEQHSDSGRYISVADVYSAPPYDLVAQHQHPQPAWSGAGDDHGAPARAWYFLMSPVGGYYGATASASGRSRRTRRSRAVAGTNGKGRWRTEAGRMPVEGTAGGYMSKFSYQEKTTSSSGTTKPRGWLMAEYGIDGYDTVIAKIYRSPRRPATNEPPSSTASTSSSTSTSIWRSVRMTDAGDVDVLDSVEPHSHQGLPHYPPYFANHYLGGRHYVAPAAAGQGVGHYLAGQDHFSAAAGQGQGQGGGHYLDDVCQPIVAMENHYLGGQDHVSAAATAAGQGQGQGAGHYYLVAVCQPTAPIENHYLAGQDHVSTVAAAAGAGHYLAARENYVAATAAIAGQGARHYLAGQHHVSAAAPGQVADQYPMLMDATAPGQVAGHYPMLMDAAAQRVCLGHADDTNMVVLGHNQTVLGAGGYERQAQHLIPESSQPEDAHTACPRRLNSGLPNLQLDEFALDDLCRNYYDMYFS